MRNLNIPGIRVWYNKSDVRILLYSSRGEVGKDVQRRAYAVQKRMKRLAPVWSGQMRDKIYVKSTRETSEGPIAEVISPATQTLVAEFGRREVKASGLYNSPKNLRKRVTIGPKARGRLRWGRENSASPKVLSIRVGWTPGRSKSLVGGSGVVYRPRARAAKGTHFMERSVDAALD